MEHLKIVDAFLQPMAFVFAATTAIANEWKNELGSRDGRGGGWALLNSIWL